MNEVTKPTMPEVTARAADQESKVRLVFMAALDSVAGANDRAMATPLAGRSVERGVEVGITWQHRCEEGASGGCHPRLVRCWVYPVGSGEKFRVKEQR